ncbi:hypothetical protein [Phytobacter sp. MRY16-398]|uniref:hypothetical protein n=1 Tax=Phytobacter sp. MRY16-398 TaxID=2487150 RepID=UPI000DF60A0C|nr:hypothetical protein [Phytobacter sp. MRY16-398]BBE76227.1 hypothetical protein MRY16398_12830 [Phytobacter sp. MRY16-398]BBE77413.1 hypothetical protein MRY16398_24690 [Phytobacter sp. MRY16-398]
MKQVTMESVKQRINELTSTGIVSLRGEFELACLCQLVAVTEQRDALVAEAAALKSGDLFFSYGSEHGFEWHKTAKEAAENAEAAIDDYRGDACDGWPEEVSSICWGVIMQSSTMVGERPRNEDDCVDSAIDTICDYALLPAIETSATSSAIAALRAEGVEMFAKKCSEKSKQAISSDTRDNWWLCGEHADDFARQLRESKGEASNV